MGVMVADEKKIKNTTHPPPFEEGELVNVFENNILTIRRGTYLAYWVKRRAHIILPPSRQKPGATKLDALVFLPGFNGEIRRAARS